MKAYIAIKYHVDGKNRHIIEAISNALEKNGFETLCVFRDIENWGQLHFSPEELMTKAFECITSSDLVVIDLTEKGVGLGIEAGFAFANKIPIVTIARDGSDISTTLLGISQAVHTYATESELSEIFAISRTKVNL
jgi:nucleoside 2-deoxyribosyltransferase